MDPLFKYYYREYTKDEFMMDSEVTFFKLKRFLQHDPKVLRDDPLITHEYQNILNMIKQKRMMEISANEYDPTKSELIYYHNVDEEMEKAKKAVKSMIEK